MKLRDLFLRDFKAGSYIESFFVAAIVAVLGIRFFLRITGYFAVGSETLHIAHVLWGGLLMMASILTLLLTISEEAKRAAAIAGGIGFGTFIDEIGKFVTRDNDYFFRPTIALIYVVLVLAILIAREAQKRGGYSRNEYLVNALRELEGAALHDLDAEEQRRALEYLSRADPDDPLIPLLKEAVARSILVQARRPGLASRIRNATRGSYRKLAGQPWFDETITVFFAARMALALGMVAALMLAPGIGSGPAVPGIIERVLDRFRNPGPAEYAEAASSMVAGLLGVVGIFRIKRNRAEALRYFERSVLVTVLLTQVFAFYRRQLSAITGLIFHVALLVVLRYMADRERAQEEEMRALVSGEHGAADPRGR